jgi:hypothetical protein
MPRWLRSFASAVVLLCAAVAAGCRSKPGPPRVTDEMRAAFGEVAVAASGSFCPVDMRHGLTGTSAGVDAGFRRGTRALWEWPFGVLKGASGGGGGGGGGGGTGDGVGMAVYGAVVVAATAGAFAAAVIYVPVSTAAGGLTAVPADEADAAEAILIATGHEFTDAGPIADAVARGARLRRGRDVVARDAADTLVLISAESISRGETEGWLSYDKSFAIATEVEATIISRGDVIWSRKHSTGDSDFAAARRVAGAEPPHDLTYLSWAADGGAPLRAELAWQFAVFGELFAEEIFGPPPRR